MKCDLCGAPVINGKCSDCGKEFTGTETACDREYGQAHNNSQDQYYYGPGGSPSGHRYAAAPEKKKLTHRTGFIVLWLILFFPAGLFMMWKNADWNKVVKIIVTVIIATPEVFTFISSRTTGYDPAEDFTSFTWPESAIAGMLPEPESSYGSIVNESEDSLMAEVGRTSRKDYNTYVKGCKSKGFTVDYSSSDNSYNAQNKSGYKLMLSYDEDNRIMSIDLDAPAGAAEKASSSDSAVSKDSKEKKSSSSGVDPDFKALMDSYEEFFDDYIAFMEKYSKSSDTSALLSDYTDYMQKYSEVMSKLDAVDEDELNAAELAYYTKVMSRITQKLSEASL